MATPNTVHPHADIAQALRAGAASLTERIEDMERERGALLRAAEELAPPALERRAPARARRVSREARQAQVIEHLRLHPEMEYTLTELATAMDAPYTSIYAAVVAMGTAPVPRIYWRKETTHVLVRYRPVALRPGQLRAVSA